MAPLPLFYHNGKLQGGDELWLEEDTARHVVQVLRMQAGAQLKLTDGNGHLAEATITEAQKKKCQVKIDTCTYEPNSATALHMYVAFTKNASRNEWLLEKLTETGIQSIMPLMATRSEKQKIKQERWHNILVSAMLQSQQCWLPLLAEPVTFEEAVKANEHVPQKLVAHCMDDKARQPIATALQPHKETIIFIGPEGDFTPEEVALCEANGFTGISLSDNRLRTETAAMAAGVFFNLINHG